MIKRGKIILKVKFSLLGEAKRKEQILRNKHRAIKAYRKFFWVQSNKRKDLRRAPWRVEMTFIFSKPVKVHKDKYQLKIRQKVKACLN